MEGELSPGERIVESTLAAALGVSQTPVREALASLAREGLVVKVDHRGTFVTSLDPRQLYELLTLRAVLEGYCARLLSQRLTSEGVAALEALIDRITAAAESGDLEAVTEIDFAFHWKLCELSGHRLLRDVLSTLQRQMRLALAVADAVYSVELRDVVESHRALVQALTQGDPDIAERAAKNHVLQVLPAVAGNLSDEPR